MKKLGFLTAAIWVISLIIMPQAGYAKMTVMSDNELKEITGQAGITIQPQDVMGLNIDAERLSFNDGDAILPDVAFALSDTTPGVTFSEPTEVDLQFASMIAGDGKEVMGINMSIKDLEVNIDEITTDLRLGGGDASSSLGILYMKGFRAHISGNVRIYTRQ